MYQHPYPSPELAAAYPFRDLDFVRFPEDEMRRRADDFHQLMVERRSPRLFAPDPVPRDLIETAIATAATAPSGAHKQPWRFVMTADVGVKRAIREAAEAEERVNYLENRMNEEWQEALAPIGTDHHKEFLEIAPWIVVLFEERYEIRADGQHRKNYYVKESVGIAAGMFITALHNMGLATLPHTPSPMAFLTSVLGRPANERPFVMFPVGHPLPGVQIPDFDRKPIDAVRVEVTGASACD
ncbi:MAG: nitroreductase family protein [Acidimicrobiales bacterium]|nr:nitroreductase family protein [Acidimicrobiales bacterium]